MKIQDCTRCPRLARHLRQIRQAHPSYYARPVPDFGSSSARLLIIGLAPGMHGANRTGRPFTGDHAGILLYETLHEFGFATQPEAVSADDALKLIDCRITNAVRCLPPGNKPSTDEVRNCNSYLVQDLQSIPRPGVAVALGGVAHRAALRALGEKQSAWKFEHAAEHAVAQGLILLNSYHCSRYNTQTRRLTPAMFKQVFARARALVERGSS